MYKIAKPLFLHCLTPMHAGSGSDLGIIDLPIQRERHTSFPKIESSSLKGALREACEFTVLKPIQEEQKAFEDIKENLTTLNQVFGFDDAPLSRVSKDQMKSLFGEKEKDFAGAIGFTDARLLLFPIKSMRGVFVWATCEIALQQLKSDLSLATEGEYKDLITAIEKAKDSDITNACYTSSNIPEIKGKDGQKVVLEEYTFSVKGNNQVKDLAQKLSDLLGIGELKDKLVVLPNDDFKDFVNLSTEVITRTKISNVTGTVDKENGALFTEEYLPTEAVMYSLVMAHDEFKANGRKANKVMESFESFLPEEKVVQIGGNATLGKGMTQLIMQ